MSSSGKSRSTGAKRAPRGHLTEAAYQHVKALILDGAAKPGDRININDIIAALSASKQPVMSALRRLANEGFVAITPQSGCHVTAPDRHVIEDFFRAFAAVEGVAAEIAAERAAPKALPELVSINDEMAVLNGERGLTVVERGHRYRRLNQRFHRFIHTMSGSGLLSALSEGFWDKADFYIASTFGVSPFASRIGTSHREHQEVIAAIADRDGERARRLMEAHIRSFASAASD